MTVPDRNHARDDTTAGQHEVESTAEALRFRRDGAACENETKRDIGRPRERQPEPRDAAAHGGPSPNLATREFGQAACRLSP